MKHRWLWALSCLFAVTACAGEPAGEPPLEVATAALATGLPAAVPYLRQAENETHFALVEASVEQDANASLRYIDDALASLAAAQVQICGVPLCTGDWVASVNTLPGAVPYLHQAEGAARSAVVEASVEGDLDETLNYVNETTNSLVEAMVRIQGWPDAHAAE